MKRKSINPHDQSVVGEVQISRYKDIKNKYTIAKKSFDNWKQTTLQERAKYIKKFASILKKNKQKVAKLTTLEMGKPISQSIEDIESEIKFLNYYAKEGVKVLKDKIVLKNKVGTYRVVYEPYGVVGIISPWNFPVSMATSGIIPALLAGNTIIFKPSEHTSLTQQLIIELLWETKLPEGTVNIVIGDSKVGKLLLNQEINLIWFTGSTATGQLIYQKAGMKFIPAILEMGGSSPGIVFSDAHIDHAVQELVDSRFLNCGQVCSAIKRIFVEKPIYQKFVKKYVQQVEKLTIGNPMTNVDIGPLVSKKQFQRLKFQLREAVSKGAIVQTGGKKPKIPELAKGNYFQPTVVTNLDFNMRLLKEEIFGPIIPIMEFETETQAIDYANDTQYGLTAEIYTSDKKRAERVASQIQAGVIGINTDDTFHPECPFGGFKLSGMGREYGQIGFHEFVQTKTIAVAK